MQVERCNATWRQIRSVKICCCGQWLQNWHWKKKTVERRDSGWHAMQRSRERVEGGGWGTGRCGKTSNWPPLWIFPNTGYYVTVSFWYSEITAKAWQWREIQRRRHCYSVLVSHLARKQPFKGLCRTTGRRGRKRNERRNKETLKSRQLVNEWKYTTSHSGILNHTDRDRKGVILIRLNQTVFRHHEIYWGKKPKSCLTCGVLGCQYKAGYNRQKNQMIIIV